MLKNYIKIAFRNLQRQKTYSLINIAGLALGMACFLLIVRYVQFEMSFDSFHENGKRIYRVNREGKRDDYVERRANIGAPLAPLLFEQFPGIEDVVRFTNFFEGFLSHDKKSFKVKQLLFTDESIFNVFTFLLIQGDPLSVLKEPFSIVITQEMAKKYFGDQDPINQILSYKLSFRKEKFDFKVTGILDRIPKNSHIDINFLASYSSLRSMVSNKFFTERWDSPTWTYVLLQNNYQAEEFEKLFPAFAEKYVDKGSYSSLKLYLQPLQEIYFHSLGMGPPLGKMGIQLIDYVLLIVAIFILLIACINFMNLSTARSAIRAKEIGMRKVMGAQRSQLIRQFLGESLIFSFIALLFAIVLVELFLPKFNQFITFHEFIGQEMDISYSQNPGFLTAMLLTAIIVGIVSGSYPAFFLSAFKPVNILKSAFGYGRSPNVSRKILVIGQFVISIILITCSILIYQQIQYWKNKELGFNKEYVITIPILDNSVKKSYDLLKNKLLQSPNILGITASSTKPGVADPNGIRLKGRDVKDVNMAIIYVDLDYIKTLEIEVTEGRDFSKNISTDAMGALLMNQAALKKLGWQDALGEEIELYWIERGRKVPMYQTNLVGIVQDFNFRDLTMPVQPLLFKIAPNRYKHIMIRINSNNIFNTINYIEKTWKEFRFDQPFEFTFLEDDIENAYALYDKFSALVKYAAFLTIFIACLGLLGLASFTVEKRTKEIGIRKVLGASIPQIVMMLSKSFIKWVLVANFIAWPIAYLLMNVLLQNFTYRIDIHWWVFVLAGGLALVIALLTVSTLAIKAVLANPVESLRYE